MKNTCNNNRTISYFPLAAASWSGVNFHKSETLTLAPCLINISVTSKWPYEQALCKGTRPLKVKIR